MITAFGVTQGQEMPRSPAILSPGRPANQSPVHPVTPTHCQVAVSVHAATDTASCPLDWQLYLPLEWTDESDRCRRAGIPDGTVHQEKWRLALSLLDNVSGWGLTAPVVVADAGYGTSTPFRHGLEDRGLFYVLALTGKEVAHEVEAEPNRPHYGGLGPSAGSTRTPVKPTVPRVSTPSCGARAPASAANASSA
ncbi:transposase [Kitasatospora sp. NPDC056184]|uniref:transposase n=1 Tax=Kitasatospora sp. NPDC056184 TaxID=3345738 RepID=UPI0035DABC42